MKQILLKSKNFSVIRETLISSSTGTATPTEYIWQPEVVIAVPVQEDGHIILVNHTRPILGLSLLECPGGKVDPGETVEGAIKRELEEEIGFTPSILEYVNYFFSSVGTSTEKIHFFIAKGLLPHKRKMADKKRMEIMHFRKDKIAEIFVRGELHDAKSIIALGYYLSANAIKG